MVCPQCASDVAAGSSFCSACGARVSQASSPQYSNPGVQPGYPVSQPGYRVPEPHAQLGQPIAPTMLRGPGAGYGVDPKTGLPYSHRSKVVAGVLQICLGGLGVGRFYTGHTGIAIAQIAVTFLTCSLGVLWPVIDGIMILTGDSPRDIDGKPLRPG